MAQTFWELKETSPGGGRHCVSVMRILESHDVQKVPSGVGVTRCLFKSMVFGLGLKCRCRYG